MIQKISKDHAKKVIKDYAFIMESTPDIVKEPGYPDEHSDKYWTKRARIRMADPEMATREEVFKILDTK
jgi:hypothetical protein